MTTARRSLAAGSPGPASATGIVAAAAGMDATDAVIAELLGSGEVAPARLGDTVVHRFTEAIVGGRLKPGDAMPSEGRIAGAFGVSKQVAREAIRELSAMGVVEIHQGRASRVRALDAGPLARYFRFAVRGTPEGLSEAVALRRILEPPIARLAAQNAAEGGRKELAVAYARLAAAIEDVPAWIEADLDFHETIARLSHNRLLWLEVCGLRPLVGELMERFSSRRTRGRREWLATLERHRRVVMAIESGDPQAAEAAMTAHFEAAESAIEELFPALPREGPSTCTRESRGGA